MPTQRLPARVTIADAAAETRPHGQSLIPVIHSGTAPGTRLSSYGARMQPGHVSNVHLHRDSDVIVHVLHGAAATLWGPDLRPLEHGPGQQVWIPAGLEHAAVNLSRSVEVVAIEIRTDPDANADVELLPELDRDACARREELQADYHERVLDGLVSGEMPC